MPVWTQDEGPSKPPKFGRRARAWFVLALQYQLPAITEAMRAPALSAAERDALVAWFGDRARDYVRFVPTETYAGRGFQMGAWQLDARAIATDLPLGRVQVRDAIVARAAAGCGSLEEWLARDLAGTLEGAATGGAATLPASLARSLSDSARRRREGWPRTCTECGESWTARDGREARAARCQQCRGVARATFDARSCLDCRSRFDPTHWNQQFCRPCKAAGAAKQQERKARRL